MINGVSEERVQTANDLAAATRRLALSGNIVFWSLAVAAAIVVSGYLISRHAIGEAQDRVTRLNGRIRSLYSDIAVLNNNARRIEAHWGHVYLTPYEGGNGVVVLRGYNLTRLRCSDGLACYRVDKVSR